MDDEFEIVVGSDPDSDGLFGEIWFGDDAFAEILEPPPYELVVYPRRDGEPWRLPFPLVHRAVEAAKQRMDEMQPRRE